jgi:hypothetical protein
MVSPPLNTYKAGEGREKPAAGFGCVFEIPVHYIYNGFGIQGLKGLNPSGMYATMDSV